MEMIASPKSGPWRLRVCVTRTSLWSCCVSIVGTGSQSNCTSAQLGSAWCTADLTSTPKASADSVAKSNRRKDLGSTYSSVAQTDDTAGDRSANSAAAIPSRLDVGRTTSSLLASMPQAIAVGGKNVPWVSITTSSPKGDCACMHRDSPSRPAPLPADLLKQSINRLGPGLPVRSSNRLAQFESCPLLGRQLAIFSEVRSCWSFVLGCAD